MPYSISTTRPQQGTGPAAGPRKKPKPAQWYPPVPRPRPRPIEQNFSWALEGPGGHRRHHHGGGGRRRGGGGWGWGGPGWYPPGLPTIVEDPCTTPWLYPPGQCAILLDAQRAAQGLSGACCDGCAQGSQCSGGALSGVLDMVPGGSMPVKLGVLGVAAYLAYKLLLK